MTAALQRHELAMSYIGEIRQLLDAAEKADIFPVAEYRSELPEWTAMVLCYPSGWGDLRQQQVRNFGAFDAQSLRHLRTLHPQLRTIVPTWDAEQRQGFADAVDELQKTLKEDPTIKGQLAEYLLTLILHMRQVLAEYDMRGDFALSRALVLLKGTVYTAADASTDPPSKPKREWLKKVFEWGPAARKVLEWSDIWGPLIVGPGTGG